MLDTTDTIAAIATARVGALRGIVRVSGPNAMDCLASIFEPDNEAKVDQVKSPTVLRGTVHVAKPIGAIPCDVYVWPGERSYTRQPCFELHTLGSPPILDAVLAATCQVGGRLAQPGEFTMRAFLAGRLDLTQAEAVLGVIDARDTNELRVALQQLAGGLARPLHDLRDRLLDLLARLEAGLDFVEEDIEFISAEELGQQLSEINDLLTRMIRQMSQRSHDLADSRVVIVGWPNVGKSSLFNALTGASAIVSQQAGTTRDYVTHSIDLRGRKSVLIDTAGVEAVDRGGLSAAAQEAGSRQAERATLLLFCLDASRPMNAWEQRELVCSPAMPRLVVLNKCDLPRQCEWAGDIHPTSCRSGAGIAALRQAIAAQLEAASSNEVCIGSTAVRCRECLRRAGESLDRAGQLAKISGGEELIAAELRVALDELGAVAGTVYTDDILDRIFSKFCIGK